MSDLIKRDEAIETAVSAAVDWHRYANPYYSLAACIGEAMSKIPSAERKGKWIPHYDAEDYPLGCRCSVCNETYVMPDGWANFCPNCGADMRGEEDE